MTVHESAVEIIRLENEKKEKVMIRLIDPRSSKIEYKTFGQKSIGQIYREFGLFFRDGNSDFNSFFQTFTDMLLDVPEPRIHIFRSCPNFIRQIEGLNWDSWASLRAREEKGIKDRPKKLDDDYVDCAKYLINSNLRPVSKESIAAFKQKLMERWADHQFL
jgi:hypothetical protein